MKANLKKLNELKAKHLNKGFGMIAEISKKAMEEKREGKKMTKVCSCCNEHLEGSSDFWVSHINGCENC